MKFNNQFIGILTDLHFGKHKEEKWEEIYNNLLDWIIEEYTKRGIKQILILGDIFDGHFSKTKEKGISFKILDFAVKWLNKLSDSFEIILFSGNHDLHLKDSCEISACSIFKNHPKITLIEETTGFEFEDKSYQIVPWSCKPLENSNGMFCHMDIQTFKLNAVKKAEHGFSSKELFKVTDKVWSGHYHWFQERDYQKGKKKITYLGTPLQLDWSEKGKDSFIFVFDLLENEISEKIENKISPKHVQVKASQLDKTKITNDFIEVLWDIEKTPEQEELANQILEEASTVKFNLENLSKKKSLEFEKIVSSLEPENLLEEAVDALKEVVNKEEVLEKTKEIFKLVKK